MDGIHVAFASLMLLFRGWDTKVAHHFLPFWKRHFAGRNEERERNVNIESMCMQAKDFTAKQRSEWNESSTLFQNNLRSTCVALRFLSRHCSECFDVCFAINQHTIYIRLCVSFVFVQAWSSHIRPLERARVSHLHLTMCGDFSFSSLRFFAPKIFIHDIQAYQTCTDKYLALGVNVSWDIKSSQIPWCVLLRILW